MGIIRKGKFIIKWFKDKKVCVVEVILDSECKLIHLQNLRVIRFEMDRVHQIAERNKLIRWREKYCFIKIHKIRTYRHWTLQHFTDVHWGWYWFG